MHLFFLGTTLEKARPSGSVRVCADVSAANRLVSSKIFTLIPFEGLDASGIGPEGTSVTLRSKLKLHLQLISCDSLEYACVIS